MKPPTTFTGSTSDWMGTLDHRGSSLRVVVHIRPTADSTLAGTVDNIDVGCMDIHIDEAVFGKTTLRFDASIIDGSYRGRIRKDGRTIAGTWRMGGDSSPLLLSRVKPSLIQGIWAGTLILPSMRLRLFFYIGAGPACLIAAMKSPDQSDQPVPMSSAELRGSTLVLEATSIAARFEGTANRSLKTIEGTWTQGDRDLPLILKRIAEEEELQPDRPQEPSPPYPYREEEVRYRRRGAAFELAGTLTIPKGKGPFPAVLLIAGSGALDRNETMYDHRPFLVLADFLTRRGFAVLRSDKRGVGESGGDDSKATTTDFARGARAGIAYLRTRSEVNRDAIGLVGHSEGGLIACMLAAQDRDLAFIVLMAAPGVPGSELACQQAGRRAEMYGGNREDAERQTRKAVALLRKVKDGATLRRKLTQMFSTLPEAQRNGIVGHLMLPWQRHFATLNPATYLGRVRCPVLALNGERDTTVEARSNLAAIRQALKSGGNRNRGVIELSQLNHLFQTCTTGLETEYWHITETLAPAFLEKMSRWITKSCAAPQATPQ